MQKEKNKIITALCWILVFICMAVIFWLSSRTAEQSSEQSGALLQWLLDNFGDNFFTDFIVRKLAHFLEFAGLCFLFNTAFLQTNKRKMPVISVLCTSVYAASDEFHQFFVEGRSCQLSDWAIDTAGAILSSAVFLIIAAAFSAAVKKKNTIDTGNN